MVHVLLGYGPNFIVLPILKTEIEAILAFSDVLHRTLAELSGEISFHYPPGKA